MAHHLREIMQRRNMTADSLSRATQISRRSIYNWLDGRPISSAYLKRVARALGVLPEDIQRTTTSQRRLYNTGEPIPASKWNKSRRG